MQRLKQIIIFFSLLLLCLVTKGQVTIDTLYFPYSNINAVARPTCSTFETLGNNHWVGTRDNGIYKFTGTNFVLYNIGNSNICSNNITAISLALNSLYAGTLSSGLAKFDGINWDSINTNNSNLISDSITCITGSTNDLWIGTRHGLSHFDGSNWTNYTTSSGLPSDYIYNVLIASNGSIWCATDSGLCKSNGSAFIAQDIGLENFTTKNMFEDSEANIWIEALSSTTINQINNDFSVGYNVRIIKNGNVHSLREFIPMSSGWGRFRLVGSRNGKMYAISSDQKYYLAQIYDGNIWAIDPLNWSCKVSSPFQLNTSLVNISNARYIHENKSSNISFDNSGNLLLTVGEAYGSTSRRCYFKITFTSNFDPINDANILDINNLNALFNFDNRYFSNDMNNASVKFKDSPTSPFINSATLWMGGMDSSQVLKVASVKKDKSDFFAGPLDTTNATVDSITQIKYSRIWKISSSTIDYFRYQYNIGNVLNGTYLIPDELLTWPANPTGNQSKNLAPFFDYNNDGTYNPMDGDYPIIRGNQQLFWISNDNAGIHQASGSTSNLGVEIHTSVYGYNCRDNSSFDSLLHNTIFIHLDLYNRSAFDLHDFYTAINNHSGLGSFTDDYIGFNVGRNYYYNYNADNYDDSPEGFGLNPPIFNCVLLQGPLADSGDGIDNNRNQIIDEADERMLLSNFMSYNSDGTVVGLPNNSTHYYDYMHSVWKDGTKLVYGGNGHITPGSDTCRYLFPGTTDPSGYGTQGNTGLFAWSETLPDAIGGSPNEPGYRQSTMSIGPTTFAARGHYTLDFAYLLTWYKNLPNGANTSWFLNNLMVDSLNEMWATGHYPCSDFTSSTLQIENLEASIYPNPAQNNLHVKTVSRSSITYLIIDINGRVLKEKTESQAEFNIYTGDLTSGIYYIKLINSDSIKISKFIIVR